ncbi:MAG TPA: hypothetical protein P5102_14395, partial [Candidatus Competibacteraceae bacterium]|nr:hypothetical protein [Candidatus Competibacteraceae bacterium]HRZ07313.1 hypothetical protein [Candidatus Competibacteraceae bacterium]
VEIIPKQSTTWNSKRKSWLLKLTMEIFFWEDFHERYLITDIVGIGTPAGFDITGKPDDWSYLGPTGS